MWRRPHRWITVPAGLALFLGIWFPVLGDAHDRIYPITIPPVWPSYVLGLLAALAALTTGRRRSKLVLTAQILVWLMLGATAVVMIGVLVVPGFGDATMAAVFALAIGLVLITGIGSFDELAASRVTMSAGFLGAAWFGALRIGQPDPLIGTKLSLFASIGLLAGGLAWRREIVRERRFPRATATVRRT